MLRLKDIDAKPVIDLLRQFDLEFIAVEDGKEIPGSHWGEEELSLIHI